MLEGKVSEKFICIRLTEIPFGFNILFHQKDRERYVRGLPRFPHNASLEQISQKDSLDAQNQSINQSINQT